ncbi:ATP-dependent DNA helicase MER3 [Dimargaris xerosporica]|nr:ATP-dependent DNA helicase MER3 [Dimargaris xerosporica]
MAGVGREVTGDTDIYQLHQALRAQLIITTPEKWDSISRRWRDNANLIRTIRLLMIDEVHILNDNRGATLEAVVSRMRMINPMMRIVAISATIPNIHDIAQWLGASPTNLPPGDGHVQPLASVQGATVKAFGDEYRPVPLLRHVIGFESSGDNYFLFEKRLDYQLPDIIAQYANGKPALVSAQQSAEYLAKHMKTHAPETLNKSAPPDWCMNHFISESYVNLPAHLVIVKGTRAYANSKYVEYSNLDILQMMGRAGRPQFDTSGVAVILTTQDRVIQYEQVVSGHQPIESSDPKLGHQMAAEMRTIVLQAYRILKFMQYYIRRLQFRRRDLASKLSTLVTWKLLLC